MALKNLIENSQVLDVEVKTQLLGKITSMSEDDIEAMGKFLAKEVEFNYKDGQQ